MKPFTYESHAGSHKTSPEKPKLHLYRPDGSVHYIRPELSATKGAGSSSALPTREVDFEQLPDGRLAEIIEDPDDPKRSLLAVGRDDSYELVKSVQSGKETLVPIPRQEELLRSVRLPRGIEGLRGMTTSGVVTRENVFFTVHNFIREHVAVKPEHAFVLTFFVVSTWFVDRMHIAPYLMIVGPPQSGKTTLLNVLALLCRRPLLIGDISSAALYRTVSRIHPTLLLDESTTQVGQSYRAQRHFLRLGSTRQGVARYGEMFDCYGAKVFAALEPPSDDALNSRSIIIPMLTANP
jgi:hypothetical protein